MVSGVVAFFWIVNIMRHRQEVPGLEPELVIRTGIGVSKPSAHGCLASAHAVPTTPSTAGVSRSAPPTTAEAPTRLKPLVEPKSA